MTNVQAAEAVVESLRASGMVEDADEALVELALSLAAAVDADSTNAAMWREYRAVVEALRAMGRGAIDDDAAQFLVTVRTPVPPKVGDQP